MGIGVCVGIGVAIEVGLGVGVGVGDEVGVGEGVGVGVEVGEVLFVEPLEEVEKIVQLPVPSGFLPADCPEFGVEISPDPPYVTWSIGESGLKIRTNFIVSPSLLSLFDQLTVAKLPP